VLGHVTDPLDAGRGQASQDAPDDVDLLVVVDDRRRADEAPDVLAGRGIGDDSD
jgi:hypothetical protein